MPATYLLLPVMANYEQPEILQTAISVSLTAKLLNAIDARATQLHLPRSRYLCLLAQTDIKRGGPLTLTPLSNQTRLDDFLDDAIPLLEDFLRNSHHPLSAEEFLAAVHIESLEDRRTWESFFAGRKHILDLKWVESQKAEKDIGWTAAILIWVKDHRPDWLAEYLNKNPASK